MKKNQTIGLTRRDFLCQMTLWTGAGLVTTAVPHSALGFASDVTHNWLAQSASSDYAYDDAALAPYYPESAGFGRAHLVVNSEFTDLDDYLLV